MDAIVVDNSIISYHCHQRIKRYLSIGISIEGHTINTRDGWEKEPLKRGWQGGA